MFQVVLIDRAVVDNQKRMRHLLMAGHGYGAIGFPQYIFDLKQRINALLAQDNAKLLHLQAVALKHFKV